MTFSTFRLFGFQIQYCRLPSGGSKQNLLYLIDEAKQRVNLKRCLDLIGLSSSRYYSWVKRRLKCKLPDTKRCQKSSPTMLTWQETKTIKDMITSTTYRHFSISPICLHARRISSVFASEKTWNMIAKKYDLTRPGNRVYPPKPKIGLRADAPFKIWHLDMSVIRLVDGRRCFIQAIIDNFSRYVLGWLIHEGYGGSNTKELILSCLEKAKSLGMATPPNIMVDSGTENINSDFDSLIGQGLMTRTTAQIDIQFSNSMIEALFHRLKHRYLCLNTLTDIETLRKLVNKYHDDANQIIPLKVLGGATPLEFITNAWSQPDIDQLTQSNLKAKQDRVEFNRKQACGTC